MRRLFFVLMSLLSLTVLLYREEFFVKYIDVPLSIKALSAIPYDRDWFLAFVLASLIVSVFPSPVRNRVRKVSNIRVLEQMTWDSFEKICRDYYQASGYKVKLVGGSGGDGGIDLLLRGKGGTTIVQCKHWNSRVGVAVVREMFGVMISEGADRVVIIATKGFTKDSRDFAKRHDEISLISGHKFIEMIGEI